MLALGSKRMGASSDTSPSTLSSFIPASNLLRNFTEFMSIFWTEGTGVTSLGRSPYYGPKPLRERNLIVHVIGKLFHHVHW